LAIAPPQGIAMRATEPLPLYHSWPIDALPDRVGRTVAVGEASGHWRCDLADDKLAWDASIFDLFGLPRTAPLTRELALRCYAEDSRAAMERLRTHAIRFRRGFTLDVEVGPPAMPRRWIRLVAAPVLDGDRAVALEGVKSALPA
jgi:hypothetical protein